MGHYVGGIDGWRPYPGVVGNGYSGFPVMVAKYGGQVWPSMVAKYGGQVKCAQLHWSNSNICWSLFNDDIVPFIPLLLKTEI